jgi:hypothetical protein
MILSIMTLSIITVRWFLANAISADGTFGRLQAGTWIGRPLYCFEVRRLVDKDWLSAKLGVDQCVLFD